MIRTFVRFNFCNMRVVSTSSSVRPAPAISRRNRMSVPFNSPESVRSVIVYLLSSPISSGNVPAVSTFSVTTSEPDCFTVTVRSKDPATSVMTALRYNASFLVTLTVNSTSPASPSFAERKHQFCVVSVTMVAVQASFTVNVSFMSPPSAGNAIPSVK